MSRNLAEGATKEESAMLTNSVTSKKREVDVVLRTRTAGVELVISIEATGLSEARRQASPQPEASLQPDPVDAGGGANRFATGIAKPIPIEPLWALAVSPILLIDAIAEFIPMSAPFMSTRAPPELPGLSAASVWMASNAAD